ncbi:MAG: hypothetical protein CR993_09460 [Rhodobacterales bacterium]|nr:MAG: hypothetical protein CR993_09460 [Rhodobacterales bacterium]
MKLVAREDIEAPIDAVFRQLSDFDGFERAALRRGAEVQRTDSLTQPGAGMGWRASFDFRGKERLGEIEMTAYDRPNAMVFQAKGMGVDLELEMELVSMSPARTRLNMSTDIRPRSIPAKLVVQSMKVARSNVLRKYRKRIAKLAEQVEARCRG